MAHMERPPPITISCDGSSDTVLTDGDGADDYPRDEILSPPLPPSPPPQPPPRSPSPATGIAPKRTDRQDIWTELLDEAPHLLYEEIVQPQGTPGVLLRAASINWIVYMMAIDFPVLGPERHTDLEPVSLVVTFLRAHRWVVSSRGLLQRLIYLYRGPPRERLLHRPSRRHVRMVSLESAMSMMVPPHPESGHRRQRSADLTVSTPSSDSPSSTSPKLWGLIPLSPRSTSGSPASLPPLSPMSVPGTQTPAFLLSRWTWPTPTDLLWSDELRDSLRENVLRLLRFWIERQPSDFVVAETAELLDAFLQELRVDNPDEWSALVDARSVAFSTLPSEGGGTAPSSDAAVHHKVRRPLRSFGGPPIAHFDSLDPAVLAAQFTALEFDYYRNIRSSEFHRSTWRDGDARLVLPHLHRSIQHFNRVSFWVVAMILSEADASRRALVYAKLIKTAKKLKQLRNYNTLMAFFAGLKHNAVHRLKVTFESLPRKTQATLQDIADLLSPEQNFEQYRRTIANTKGFCIPYLGLTLTDLTHLADALGPPAGADSSMINFQRLAQMAQVVDEALAFQGESLPVEPDFTLMQVLRVTLFPVVTESELYELSLLREPRQSGHRRTDSSRRKSWQEVRSSPQDALGKVLQTFFPADRGLLSSARPSSADDYALSVEEMVAAIVQTFDTDRNNVLSEDEFGRLASFFPFLPPFHHLDSNKDGAVEQKELVEFFLTARNVLSPCETHRFVQHTVMRAGSQRCYGCNRVVFGISGKYVRCVVCGVVLHMRCSAQFNGAPTLTKISLGSLGGSGSAGSSRRTTADLLDIEPPTPLQTESPGGEQEDAAESPRKGKPGGFLRHLAKFSGLSMRSPPATDQEATEHDHE